MKFTFTKFTIFLCMLLTASIALAAPAPDFTATDSNGKTHKLSDLKGKTIVLEWFNHGCPFVKKHYESKNMQSLQEKYIAKDVVWFTVNSSAAGKQGYMTNEETNEKIKSWNIKATAALIDSEGTIGKAYNAKTTPHMFIIDPAGELVYQGAIDDNDSAKISSIEGATNYVSKALDEILDGKAVSTAETESYGCSVKYKS